MIQNQEVVVVVCGRRRTSCGCVNRMFRLLRRPLSSIAPSHAKPGRRLIPTLRLVRDMKADGVKPSLAVYNALLTCIAQEGLPLEAWAVVDDMTAMGILPDRSSYHHILHVSQTPYDHAAC